jgi:eukaryotic-like serine/threonine-protein kinase
MTPAPDLNQTVITPPDWLPGYEMLSVVGAGGFGTVYKARQFKLDRVVAVKMVYLDPATQPALAARFENEAVTLGRLHHPNIVQVYDYGFHVGRMFIVMELLEGEDLGVRLKNTGKLSEQVAWSVARQAASALAHAASQGVIHRDVKPPNLVLLPSPTGFGLPPGVPLVKVTDFGLARTKWAVGADDGRLTAPGTVLGTPLYMAPEQYRATADQDHRIDIYALGATVFHALAGNPPFAGDNVWDVMAQKMERSPRSWPTVSRESVALIEAMMAPDPADRIGNYEDLIARIDALPAMRTTGFVPAIRHRKRKWTRYALAAAGSVAVAAFGIHIGLPSAPVAAVNHSAPRFESAGDLQSLLDNTSLADWMPPSAGGVWGFEQDEEKGKVLAGTGFTRRRFHSPEDHRIIIGLDLHKADAAEIHFGLRPDGRRFVFRVTKAGSVLGIKNGDRSAFQPLTGEVAFPPEKALEGRSHYLEVRIDRAGGIWSVRFNGKDAGHVADDGPPKLSEIRLNAEGGMARVDSVILESLRRAE